MKNSCPLGFEPEAFRLRSERATTELRGIMSAVWIKRHLLLHVLFLEIYLQHMVDVTKIICHVFLSHNIYIVLLLDQLTNLTN